jgi:DNA invertase Pin-like site-specific DNA recombinase
LKKCAIYTRVSTADQTVENQKRELLRYCQARELEVVALFEDVGVSGAKMSRPRLDEMMKQARQRRFEVFLVWKFDRFARSTSHLLAALQEFRDLGIDFSRAWAYASPVGCPSIRLRCALYCGGDGGLLFRGGGAC